jgi:hypothetical protein
VPRGKPVSSPVEGKKVEFDEQVVKEGNQPIPQPTEPKSEDVHKPIIPQVEETTPNEKLPLGQSEEQGEWSTGMSCENCERVDKANWATTVMVNDLEPQISSDQSRGGGGGVSWINPRKHPKKRREVNSEGVDNTKSIPTGPELVSTTIDPNETLSKGQYPPPTITEITKTKHVPYRETENTPTYVLIGTNPESHLHDSYSWRIS